MGWELGLNGVVPGQRNMTTVNIMQGDQHFETGYCSSILYIQLLISMSLFLPQNYWRLLISHPPLVTNPRRYNIRQSTHRLIDLTRHVCNPSPASYARHGRALYPCLKS